MLNQNLVNVSPVDVELCQIKDFSLNSAKSEILPSIFNFVIVELNNLEELINDFAYLEENFTFKGFSKDIRYKPELGFFVQKGFNYTSLIKLNPNELIKMGFDSFILYHTEGKFYLEEKINLFCQYIEDFKADYLAYMKDVQASQRRILEKIGCE